MGSRCRLGGLLALACLATAVPDIPRAAEAGPPDAATLLFDEEQLRNAAPGTTLTYAYSRKSADANLYGPTFDDTILLAVEAGKGEAERTLRVTMFSGEHRRAAGPFVDMTGNPVLSLFLENHLQEIAPRLKANPRYIKNAIRTALRDKAKVEKTAVSLGGRSLEGWHVRVEPFRDDPNRGRMQGLDTMVYDFTVAAEVPGEIIHLSAAAPAADGKFLIDESLSYEPKAP